MSMSPKTAPKSSADKPAYAIAPDYSLAAETILDRSVSGPITEPKAPTPDYTSRYTRTVTQMLNRSESAAVLGISKSEFLRRERLEIYVPTAINELGWRLYSMDYLSTLPGFGKEKRPLEKQSSPFRGASMKEAYVAQNSGNGGYPPELAAKVFEELDNGTKASEIVKKLVLHPNTLKSIYAAYMECQTMESGGFCLSTRHIQAINELPLAGHWPSDWSADQLVANLREMSRETAMCQACGKHPQQICVACATPEEQPALPGAYGATSKQPTARSRKSA